MAFKNGMAWATSVVKTTAPPSQVRIAPDRDGIKADGVDLSCVAVAMTDKDGLVVPHANNRDEFSIGGPGEILATDNGDPTTFESFQAPSRKAFSGLCWESFAAAGSARDNPAEGQWRRPQRFGRYDLFQSTRRLIRAP